MKEKKKTPNSLEFSAADPIGSGCGGRSGSAWLVDLEIHTDPGSILQVRSVPVPDQRLEEHDETEDGGRRGHQSDLHRPHAR